jgi:hypothetical protein
MNLTEHLKEAVNEAVGATFATEVHEIVAKETRLAFREHETEFTAIIQSAVKQAFSEMLKTQ